ncbi:MAG: Gfo/Idh/MocA family oxidoreductase [Candidatus Latescibacteria bacterium]|nr:Gfo/Idh/MocA family oxidoreductase [Candidatus Latescibacterota bacterium]
MIRFAVVGLGVGRNRARMIVDTDGAELTAVVDLDEELAKTVGDELGCEWTTKLEDVLGRADVDTVVVTTPSGLHADIGVQVADAGKHVIVTKPMDVSTSACDRLIDACDSASVMLAVDYQSRYVDGNCRIAEAISRGWLGDLILGEARFKLFRGAEYFASGSGWRGSWAMDGGGSLANQGAHLLDMLLWYMGDVDSVYAETAVMNHDIETEDLGMAILNFTSGAKGGLVGTTTFPQEAYWSFEVHGTQGGILIDEMLNGKYRVFGSALEERMAGEEEGSPVHSIIEDVVSHLENGTELRVDGVEGRRSVALLEAIYCSARDGRSVKMPQEKSCR